MAFSQNLLLSEPPAGDPAQTNNWATMVNTNMSLLDTAVAGLLPLAVTGGNLVLTSNSGAADQARNAHFSFTGVLASNELVLMPASVDRMFSVSNGCTGAFTLTVGVNDGSGSAAAGTTVTVPQGMSVLLYSDGTNVKVRQLGFIGNSSITGNWTVGGALAVSGDANVTGNVNGGGLNISGGSTLVALHTTGSATIDGIAAVHTNLGGWSGIANFEVLSVNAGASAVSGYVGGSTGYCFLGRMDTTNGNFAGWNFNGSYVGSITSNGSSTSYNTSSDARLKENIRDADDAGAIIDSLRVRQWDWKSNGSHEAFGFVAQEEILVAPFAVHEGDEERAWGRDDSKLVPLLVKEIQALRARLAALEAKP